MLSDTNGGMDRICLTIADILLSDYFCQEEENKQVEEGDKRTPAPSKMELFMTL